MGALVKTWTSLPPANEEAQGAAATVLSQSWWNAVILIFMIKLKALFYQDESGGPDELFLGTGCQAIRV